MAQGHPRGTRTGRICAEGNLQILLCGTLRAYIPYLTRQKCAHRKCTKTLGSKMIELSSLQANMTAKKEVAIKDDHVAKWAGYEGDLKK